MVFIFIFRCLLVISLSSSAFSNTDLNLVSDLFFPLFKITKLYCYYFLSLKFVGCQIQWSGSCSTVNWTRWNCDPGSKNLVCGSMAWLANLCNTDFTCYDYCSVVLGCMIIFVRLFFVSEILNQFMVQLNLLHFGVHADCRYFPAKLQK